MTRGIHERGYTGQEGCGTGEILGRRDRKGGMQVRRDAEQERCCTGGIEKGWMHDRWDEGLDRYMKLGMQERRDAGQE